MSGFRIEIENTSAEVSEYFASLGCRHLRLGSQQVGIITISVSEYLSKTEVCRSCVGGVYDSQVGLHQGCRYIQVADLFEWNSFDCKRLNIPDKLQLTFCHSCSYFIKSVWAVIFSESSFIAHLHSAAALHARRAHHGMGGMYALIFSNQNFRSRFHSRMRLSAVTVCNVRRSDPIFRGGSLFSWRPGTVGRRPRRVTYRSLEPFHGIPVVAQSTFHVTGPSFSH
eukprot:630822-Hanusia_phi.AAC.1